ncbi:hypothetical protein EI42_03433 [Thermosporothrix hazakensis]|jgi:methyl-accepting chemotaxis protein|uniref:Uncharacterized protein n=1 Tax=Thermosporothrix hazakensis TaxID=644383 RepID=A0A326UE55_THEHA|nr:hypothetical protein [Thermosporothrix hazakensis]PZW28055.1 hypothetical protein EI42_03433 [Thermosporothrix hazakensis]GCE51277.1 hypothetical protein KTH_61460 [Thermosporothrix hazakensis]
MITPHILDKQAVRADLEEAANIVKESDELAADRLNELADAVDGGSYSDAWAASDIHQVINIPAIVHHFREHGGKGCFVGWIEMIRNVLILVPLMITWYGISGAISAYGELVQADERKSTLPFILLWQQGFDGRLNGVQAFGTIATADFIILFCVVILTVVSAYLTSLSRQKREEDADKLERLLMHGLAGARLCLTTKNWTQPTNFVTRFDQAIDSFKQVVGELVKQIQEERDALAKLATRQEEETKLFSTFKGELQTSMTGISTSVSQLQSTLTSLTGAVEHLQGDITVLSEPVKQVAQQQGILTTNSQQVISLLDAQIKALTQITDQHEQLSKDLQESLRTLETTLQENSKQADDFAETIQEINKRYVDYLDKMRDEHEEQKDLSNRIYDAAERMGRTIELLEEWNNEISAVNINMHDIVRRLAGIAPSNP